MKYTIKFRHIAISVVSFALILGFFAPFAISKNMHVLDQILQKVREAKAQGLKPIILLDLDDTVFASRSRQHFIFQEAAHNPQLRAQFPDETQRLASLRQDQVHYQLTQTLEGAGITNPAAVKSLKDFWFVRFFTNEYCEVDQPIPGAVEYANLLAQEGAYLIYLTGRDLPKMRLGTAESLRKNGFPVGPNTRLWMKPNFKIDDKAFKASVIPRIEKKGVIVAAFDNEPSNIDTFSTIPGAIVVFMDTMRAEAESKPSVDVVWLKHLERPCDTAISTPQVLINNF